MGAVVHGGHVWEAAKASGRPAEEILDFSANINSVGPSEKVMALFEDQSLLKSLITNYPDENYTVLTQALGERFAVSQERVLLGNGATELISLVLKQQSKVLLPRPSYGEYQDACVKGEVAFVHWDWFAVYQDSTVLDRLIDIEKPSAILLPMPNNPTSQLMPLEVVEQWFERYPEINWIIDASFLQFSKKFQAYWDVLKKSKATVVMSLTKYYAIPGLRLGWMLQSKSQATASQRSLDPWRVNALANEAGIRLLQDESYDALSAQSLECEKKYMTKEWGKRVKLLVPPNQIEANFLLIEVESEEVKNHVLQALFDQGILLRDAKSFGLDNVLRVAIKDSTSNKTLIKSFDKINVRSGHTGSPLQKLLKMGIVYCDA